MELKQMKAVLIEGELYVREVDCRANINAALASKKPLLEALDAYDAAADKFIAKVESGRAHSIETVSELRKCRALARTIKGRG